MHKYNKVMPLVPGRAETCGSQRWLATWQPIREWLVWVSNTQIANVFYLYFSVLLICSVKIGRSTTARSYTSGSYQCSRLICFLIRRRLCDGL